MKTTPMRLYSPLVLLAIALAGGCKKFVTVPPPASLMVGPTAFESDANAISTMTGLYSEIMNSGTQFAASGTTLYCSLASDELVNYTPGVRDEFSANQLTLSSHSTLESVFWTPAYNYIYTANAILEGVAGSKNISPPVRQMLTGEAKLMRAFCYFHLVNIFGGVPLVLQTDFNLNANLPRAESSVVYRQMITDLGEAENLLPAIYTSAERTRPNKWTATALLARIYLYQGKWDSAALLSAKLIHSGNYDLATTPASVFLKSSNETIWQLQPVNPAYNTYEGNFILPATALSVPTYIFRNTFTSDFEVNDLRKLSWVGVRSYQSQQYSYPAKYKVYGNNAPVTEYYIILRLAEQYLIRAEALAQQDQLALALADVNVIRMRAGLPALAMPLSKAQILLIIEKERRSELFAEWGHRWFDLKRTGRANAVLSAMKPATWQPTDVLWPVPDNQLKANPALTQNPGY